MVQAQQEGSVVRKASLRKTGVVVSDKMEKSVVVAVQRLVPHPLYQKRVRLTKRFLAHDEGNRCKVGDKVIIVETRPLSSRKRWRVAEILTHAAGSPASEKGT